MDATALAEVLQPDGWDLLNSLPRYDEDAALALGSSLREAGHSPELVAAALTQSRLRAAGEAKFGPFAPGMLFTQAGLEMATRLPVAARHAARFAEAGVPGVVDLCCGIGGDAMAIAGLGLPVTAVDADEVTAGVATVNLRHWDTATAVHARAEDVTSDEASGVYLDPARRTRGGKRVVDPRDCEPGWEFALSACRRAAAGGVKVAPGIKHRDLPVDAEAQWVSVDGDVTECGVWFGAARRDGVRRSALLLTGDGASGAVVVDSAEPEQQQAPDGPLGEHVYEPDGAVIRAGLVADVADVMGAHLVDPSIAYLTSADRAEHPAVRGYRVCDDLPFGVKRLRAYLAERGVGRVTIKKRGTAVTPEELRKKLQLKGSAEATLILTRVRGAQRVVVVEPHLP